MQLKVLQLDLVWPTSVSIKEIRPWVIEQLKSYGEPLRWAITDVGTPMGVGLRPLKVEAVVIGSMQ